MKKEDFVLDSEYLTTQLVVVPRYKDFLFFLFHSLFWPLFFFLIQPSETDLQVVYIFLPDKYVRQC